MVNVKLDMLAFYMYKMDIHLLEGNLDEDATYAGMDLETFISKLNKEFDSFKAEGLTKLESFIASKPNSSSTYFGFENPQTERPLPYLLEADLDNNQVLNIVDLDGYQKLKNVRAKLSL